MTRACCLSCLRAEAYLYNTTTSYHQVVYLYNNYMYEWYTSTTKQLQITGVYLYNTTSYHQGVPAQCNFISPGHTCVTQLHISGVYLSNTTITYHRGMPVQQNNYTCESLGCTCTKKLHIISVYLYNTTSYHRAVPAQHKFISPSHACTAQLFITLYTCTTKAPSACTTQHQPHITGAYCATLHQIPTTLAHLYKTTLPHYWGILVQHNTNSTLPKHAGPTQTTITTILRNHLVGSSEQLSRLAFPEESNGIFHEKKGQ